MLCSVTMAFFYVFQSLRQLCYINRLTNGIRSLGRRILPDLMFCSCYRNHFIQFQMFGETKNSSKKCICLGEGKSQDGRQGEEEERKGPEKGGSSRDHGKKSKTTPQRRPAQDRVFSSEASVWGLRQLWRNLAQVDRPPE